MISWCRTPAGGGVRGDSGIGWNQRGPVSVAHDEADDDDSRHVDKKKGEFTVAPTWLTAIAWISLALGFLSAGMILYDTYGRGLRQHHRVMEAVWPITALYLGPLGWIAYSRLGRPTLVPGASAHEEMTTLRMGSAISATHCGAGCALGDVIGEWAIFAGGVTIAGASLWPEYIADFALAYVFGILFQYWAIKPMSGLSVRQALAHAIEADTLTVIAFEVGLFGWMALFQRVLFAHPQLQPDHAAYWLMMQIGMVIGLVTSYPVNVWLVRHGVKQAMGRPVLPAGSGTRSTRRVSG
jgi:hypothetical protein